MGFETDYILFVESILTNNVSKMEELISQSDNRKPFIIKAVDEFGKRKILAAVCEFRSLGLRKELDKYIESFSSNDLILKEHNLIENTKVICVHEKNKIKNELYHLSGGSFKNVKVSEIPA